MWGYALAAGALIQGYAGYRAGLDKAALLRSNAKELRKSADLTESQGRAEAAQIDKLGAVNQSAIIAGTHAAGLTVYGSPLTAYADQVRADALESATKITSSRLAAEALRKQADMMEAEASSAALGGLLTGIGGGLVSIGAAGAASEKPAPQTTSTPAATQPSIVSYGNF